MTHKSERDLTVTDHIKTLQSRADYLAKRIAEREDKSSFYDQRELMALTWAIQTLSEVESEPF